MKSQKMLHLFPSHTDEKGVAYLLVNKDGYYLRHSADIEREWGGPSDLNTGLSFKNDYPSSAVVIDENGHIRITGRIKDIIIRGGENIAARDVEDLISAHPKVEYVAVVGMPDPDLGEQVCAYVKPAQGVSMSHTDIVAHFEEMKASKTLYPVRTEFVEEIPLTAAGKADKKILKNDIERKLKVESEKGI